LATITNTIQNNIVSTGGQTAVRDVDNLGRAQTRMGQASASAGRSFAAQSQGLGGLVGAYAGAAATVFALQAAFEALSKAAQAENIVKGTSALASEMGQSGPKILKSIKEITQGQLTLEEASNAANLALSSGFNTGQIEDLAKVALGASRALGRNLTDAMTRVVRGAAKMEPELLDELGIFTRIEPAVNAYAAKMNIAATTMTDFERRQAFLNAVIEEGTRKFANIDTTAQTTQMSLEQLSVQITELGTAFGQLVNKFLLPVVDFFSDTFGNTLLLFLGVLTLVFAKGGQILGAFAAQGITKLSALSSKMADFSASMGNLNLSTVENSAQTARNKAYERDPTTGRQGSFNPRIAGRTADQQATLTRAIAAQRDGTLSNVSAIESNNRVLTENRNNLQRNSPRWVYLNTLIASNTTALQSSNRAGRAFLVTSRALQIGVRGLGVAFSFLGKMISGIFAGVAILQLVGTLFDKDYLGDLLNIFKDNTEASKRMFEGFVGVAQVLQGENSLADQFKQLGENAASIKDIPDDIYAIKRALDSAPTDQDLRGLEAGLMNEFSAPTAQGGLGITQQLTTFANRAATTGSEQSMTSENPIFTQAQQQVQTGNFPQINKADFESSSILTASPDRAEALRLVDEINAGLIKGSKYIADQTIEYKTQEQYLLETNNALVKQARLTEIIQNANLSGRTNAEKLAKSNKDILAIRTDILAKTQAGDIAGANKARAQLALQESVNEVLKQKLETVTALIGGAAFATGQGIAEVTGSIRKIFDSTILTAEVFGKTLSKFADEYTYAEQTKEMKELIDAFVIADGTLTTLTDAFADGATNSNALSKGIFGIREQLEELRKKGVQTTSDYKDLEERLATLVDLNDQLKRTEKLSKALSDAFSKEMKAIDQAVSSGDIDLNKGVARTEKNRIKNQRDLLILQQDRAKLLEQEQATFAANQTAIEDQLRAEGDSALADAMAKELKLNEDQQAVQEAGIKARKAAQGVALELIKSTDKLLKTEKRRELVLTQKLEKIERENELIKQTVELELEKLKITGKQASAQTQINILKEQVKTQENILNSVKAETKAKQKKFDLDKKDTELLNEILQIEIERSRITGRRNQDMIDDPFNSALRIKPPTETGFAQGINTTMNPEREFQIDSDSAIKRTLQLQRAAMEKFEDNKLATATQIIALQKQQTTLEYTEQVRLINQRKRDAGTEFRNKQSANDDEIRQSQLNALQATKEIGAQMAINTAKRDVFDAEKALAAQKIKDESTILESNRALQITANKNQLADITAQKALLAFDKTALQTQIALRKADIAFVNKFAEAVNSMGEIVDAYVLSNNPNAQIPTTPVVGSVSGDLIVDLEKANALITSNADLQQKAIGAQRTGLVRQFVVQRKIFEEASAQVKQKIKDTEKLTILQRKNLVATQREQIDALVAERNLIDDQTKQLRKQGMVISANAALRQTQLDDEIRDATTLFQINNAKLAQQERLSKVNTYIFDKEINLLNLQLQNSQTRLDISQKEMQIQKQKRDFALAEKLANQGLEDEIRNALGMSDELSKLKSFMATKDDKLGAAGADRSAEVKAAQETAKVANQAISIQRKQFELQKELGKRQFELDKAMLIELQKRNATATLGGGTNAGVIEGINDEPTLQKIEQLYLDTEAAMLNSLNLQSGAIAKQQQLETEAANQKYNSTKAALEREQQLLELYASDRYQLYVKVNEAINQGVGDLIHKVFDNLAEGKSIKDGLGDIFAETFTNLRKGVLEQTIIKPVKQAMSSITSSLFGFDVNETKGADNATVDGQGSLHVKVMNGAGGTDDPIAQAKKGIEEKGMGFFEGFKQKAMDVFSSMKTGISDFGSSAMNIFKDLGGSLGGVLQGVMGGLGGLLQGAGSGIGSILSGIGSSVMGMFGGGVGVPMATGGLVGVRHMAEGGQVNALRDRVPAMLEPGEFVLRKQAARNIGSSNLHAMNSGTGGMPKITINLENSGQGKEAEQQGQPKFDTDKLVVDVVLRDIRSNGPIRKAIRSGET
jgi:hypothetical protein